MKRLALVPNIHDTNFKAVVRDLHDLHFEIYCPKEWGFGPSNPSSSEYAEDISVQDWLAMPSGFVFVFTASQLSFLRSMTKGDKLVYVPATRYENLLDDIDNTPLLTHEPDHYRRYGGRKGWYFYRPDVLYKEKDIKQCFEDKKLFQIYNLFQSRDLQGPAAASVFDKLLKVDYYGAEQPEGMLTLAQKSDVMAKGMFQIYFKSAGWCGCTVLESMQLGTPVASLSYLLYDSDYLLNDKNSIICDTPEELAERIQNISFEEYESMCKQCIIDVEEKMNKRQATLINMLQL